MIISYLIHIPVFPDIPEGYSMVDSYIPLVSPVTFPAAERRRLPLPHLCKFRLGES